MTHTDEAFQNRFTGNRMSLPKNTALTEALELIELAPIILDERSLVKALGPLRPVLPNRIAVVGNYCRAIAGSPPSPPICATPSMPNMVLWNCWRFR